MSVDMSVEGDGILLGMQWTGLMKDMCVCVCRNQTWKLAILWCTK